jgi:hypothetical protein
MGKNLRPAVLGELVVALHTEISGVQPLVVYAWLIDEEGRKFRAGAAIATVDGEVVASSKSTWIQLKNQAASG